MRSELNKDVKSSRSAAWSPPARSWCCLALSLVLGVTPLLCAEATTGRTADPIAGALSDNAPGSQSVEVSQTYEVSKSEKAAESEEISKMDRASTSKKTSKPAKEKSSKSAKESKSNKVSSSNKVSGASKSTKTHKYGSEKSDNAVSNKEGATGLDAGTLRLINRGEWKEAAARLESRGANQSATTRDAAWLAFAYMYLGDCDKLKALAESARSTVDARKAVKWDAENKEKTAKINAEFAAKLKAKAVAQGTTGSGTSASTGGKDVEIAGEMFGFIGVQQPTEINAVLVQILNEICATRYNDAESEMKLVPPWFEYDSLYNFTKAALVGKQGRPNDAIEYMQRTVGSAPEFAWGYRTLGKLQQNRLKDPVKAEASYESALALAPDFTEVADAVCDIRLAKNNFDGALDVANTAIRTAPKEATNYYRLSQIYTQQWRLREALNELEKAIDLNPEEARYYRSRATIKRYQGNLNDAIADEQKAVDLSKDKPFELVELASMNQAAGNINRAADNLEEAVKLDPKNQDAHDKLVALLTSEKRYDDLVAEYNRYIAQKPKDINTKMGLARALAGQGKVKEAIEQFKQAANLDDHNPDPHREIADLYLKAKDYPGAVKEYRNALNINPSSVSDLVALGYAHAQNDDYAQAEAAFITALALQQLTQPNTLRTSPARLNLMRALAVLLMDEGRYSEAAAQFEAIYASSKGSDDAPLDFFRLAQAKALRDLTAEGSRDLVTSFKKLSPKQQTAERQYLISTLLEAHKPDLAIQINADSETSVAVSSGTAETPASSKAAAAVKLKATLNRAQAMLQKNAAADARKLVADMVPSDTETSSEISDQYVALSEIAAANNDLAMADTLATKAVEKYPKNYKAFIQTGKISLKRGKSAEAVDFAKKALEINQYSTSAYMLLGDAQAASGKVKDASASYKHAAELYPSLIEAHRSLLDTLRKLALKDEIKREEEQIAQMEKSQ